MTLMPKLHDFENAVNLSYKTLSMRGLWNGGFFCGKGGDAHGCIRHWPSYLWRVCPIVYEMK